LVAYAAVVICRRLVVFFNVPRPGRGPTAVLGFDLRKFFLRREEAGPLRHPSTEQLPLKVGTFVR
jgi:hypothetical protein